MLGDTGVGKTSIMNQYCRGSFSSQYVFIKLIIYLEKFFSE